MWDASHFHTPFTRKADTESLKPALPEAPLVEEELRSNLAVLSHVDAPSRT